MTLKEDLEVCEKPHVIQDDKGGDPVLGRSRCRKCGGFVGLNQAHWHRFGLIDGRKHVDKYLC